MISRPSADVLKPLHIAIVGWFTDRLGLDPGETLAVAQARLHLERFAH